MTKPSLNVMPFLQDEDSARLYLESKMWPNGVCCPCCFEKLRITQRKNGFYRCNACKTDFTVRTGTVLKRSHVPLDKWLYVMHSLVSENKNISSVQLSKEIDVTQKTAWLVLNRLHEACGGNINELRANCISVSEALGKIVDVVLHYNPNPKSKPKPVKKRQRAHSSI